VASTIDLVKEGRMLTLAEMEKVAGIDIHVRNWRSAPPADIEWLIDKLHELQVELEESETVKKCVCQCQ